MQPSPPLESVQSLPGRKAELLSKVIEVFPYPIQIYAPDGTSVMVNEAMLIEYRAIGPDMVVGKYNVFRNRYGPTSYVEEGFSGRKRLLPGC